MSRNHPPHLPRARAGLQANWHIPVSTTATTVTATTTTTATSFVPADLDVCAGVLGIAPAASSGEYRLRLDGPTNPPVTVCVNPRADWG